MYHKLLKITIHKYKLFNSTYTTLRYENPNPGIDTNTYFQRIEQDRIKFPVIYPVNTILQFFSHSKFPTFIRNT